MDITEIVAIGGSSCAAGMISVLSLVSAARRRGAVRTSVAGLDAGTCVFLFDQHDLVDASDDARALLDASPFEGDPWTRFLSYVAPRFPGVEKALARLPETGSETLPAAERRPVTLRAEWLGGLTRIALLRPGADDPAPVDGLSQHAMEEEIETLRGTMDRAPFPCWRENAAGSIVWANRAYLDLAQELRPGGDLRTWPLPQTFPELRWTEHGRPELQRIALTLPGATEPRWFDIHGFPQGADRIVFALQADAVVHAEKALRGFVQTLTKTFSHLTIGLAIFDRNRQLALFNPALVDLTGLPAEMLSVRPSLYRLLDAMRERQMIPEPTDYKKWRAEVAALEKAAASGCYEDTWSLPNGQTYRVTGRPHPDGALAFVLEDISAEMSLTRRFRADLAMTTAVMDSLDEAIAVFSPSGLLTFANPAYDRLWHEPAGTQRDVSIHEAVQSWQRGSAVSPVWVEARSFVLETGARTPWAGETRLSDGRLLGCRFVPLPGAASLIGFTPVAGQRLLPVAATARAGA